MNECRGCKRGRRRGSERGPDLPSRRGPFFGPVSLHHSIPLVPPIHDAHAYEDNTSSAVVSTSTRAPALVCVHVRVLNNAHGESGLVPPTHVRSRSRAPYGHVKPHYAKDRRAPWVPFLLIARRERERKRGREITYNENRARNPIKRAPP